jgi:hypothetical protein
LLFALRNPEILPMSDDATFRGDCGRCAALCCVGLAFDRSALFDIDKLASEACPHLTPDCRCAIHADRRARGFAGCAAFDCRGAGQLATVLFNGLSWRDSDATRRQMLRAFGLLLEIQRLRLVFRSLDRPDLLAPLEPDGGWTLAALLTTAPMAIAAATTVLAALRTARLTPDQGARCGCVV